MENIVWMDEQYSVGVPSIDTQHRKLVDILNTVITAQHEKREGDVLFELVNELIEYAVVHFAHEEELLTQAGYPALVEHKLAHYEFMKNALQLQSKYWQMDEGLAAETQAALFKWLMTHILKEDRKYIGLIKDTPI